MGNGWFQVYQNAIEVQIRTTLNGIQYNINDTMYRDKNNDRVINYSNSLYDINVLS